MVSFYKIGLVCILFLFLISVSGVCAADPNNNTSINNVTDSVNDYNTIRASVDRLEANDVTQTNMINDLNTTVNNQAIKINELNTTVNDLKEDNKALREDNKALREDNKALNSKVDNQSVIINSLKSDNEALKDNNTQLDKRVKALENSSAEKDVRINELNTTVNNQSVIINSLKDDNKVLTDSNKVLTDSNKVLTDKVQALEYSKLTQSNRIKSLEIDIKNLEDSNKQLVDSNKALNSKVDNQNSIINELNTTVNNQSVIINSLKSNNEVLNTKIDNLKLENENFKNKRIEILENLTYANVKLRELEFNNNTQVAEIQKLKDTIKNLTNENNRLKAINNDLKAKQVSYADVHNAVKLVDNYVKKHKKAPDTVKCGGKSFKLNDFLKLELVKDGKERALLFKEKQGVLPNYVVVASYQLDLNIYKKLYNMK